MAVRGLCNSSGAVLLLPEKAIRYSSVSKSCSECISMMNHVRKHNVRRIHSTYRQSAQGKAKRQFQIANSQQYQKPRAANGHLPTTETAPSRRAPWPFIWSLVAAGFAASIGYSYTRLKFDHESRGVTASAVSQDPSGRYHETASTFDDDVYWTEKLSGMNRIRKRLVRKASGHVLEVSAGTGRNGDYYNIRECKSITFLDQAAEMTAVCREKFSKSAKARGRFFRNARFVTQSALDEIETPPGGFDTVVQTFGLCSTGEPVELLKNLGKVVKPESGRILLLEHGRGISDWLNRRLDESAAAHAHRHGCWWNRDIREIVEASGLEIVKEKRYLLHAGTTYWYELRPARSG